MQREVHIMTTTNKASTVKASITAEAGPKPVFDWGDDDPALLTEEEVRDRVMQFAAEKRLPAKLTRKQGERREQVSLDSLALRKTLEYAGKDNASLFELAISSDPVAKGRVLGIQETSEKGDVQAMMSLRGADLLTCTVKPENRSKVLSQVLKHQRAIGYVAQLEAEKLESLK